MKSHARLCYDRIWGVFKGRVEVLSLGVLMAFDLPMVTFDVPLLTFDLMLTFDLPHAPFYRSKRT